MVNTGELIQGSWSEPQVVIAQPKGDPMGNHPEPSSAKAQGQLQAKLQMCQGHVFPSALPRQDSGEMLDVIS
jgi:hypothetical protein